MTTALTTQPLQNLEAVFRTHGHQKEVLVEEYLRVRKQANDDYTREQAEEEIFDYIDDDGHKQTAAKRLTGERQSPIVSRETQLAVLKGMVLDYERGKRRVGLSAHTVLKAVELINKMTGYEVPQKVEVAHDHKVNVFPIISQPFRGELEPLEVVDISDPDDAMTTIPLPPSNPVYDTPIQSTGLSPPEENSASPPDSVETADLDLDLFP